MQIKVKWADGLSVSPFRREFYFAVYHIVDIRFRIKKKEFTNFVVIEFVEYFNY